MRGDQRWDETWHRLREWTQGQGPSERLAQQIVVAEGFTGLDPSHPLGGKDAGADALARRDGLLWVMAVYFPRGQQTFNHVKEKFVDDFKGVEANGAEAFAFVTNQELRRAERRELIKAVARPVEIFHLERLVAILDQPRMYAVRRQFLSIDPPDGTLDRAARLDELWRASLARCAARWTGVGIPPAEARQLAEDRAIGTVDAALHPDVAEPLIVWTAPMGSGKSISAERHHQVCLEAAASDDDAPVPVFLRAAGCLPSLQTAVEAAASEVGEVRRVGASVVVDGVDEVGYQAATELLTQARVLVGTWPSTTLLMTSRAVPVLAEAHEHRPLPPLDDTAQDGCVEIGAGDRGVSVSRYSLAQPIRATMAQPFFALLVGVWMRDRGVAPRAPIDLMAMLGDRAIKNLAVDQRHLRALALRSVSRELGPVAAGDVLDGAGADDLLATGMVERRGGGLAFVLPAVAQWFAAQALLLGEITSVQLLGAPEDLELWRYPLALAISLGSADRAPELLAPLLDREAGFAMRVLDATFGQAVLGGATPPPWREGGERAREALQSLAEALGPLAPFVCDVDDAGRVRPMAVSSGPNHLTVAFWRGEESRADVFALPEDVHPFQPGPEWATVRWSQVGPGAAWAWHWAHQEIHERLDRVLRHRALPVDPLGPLGQEAAWAAACDVAQVSELVTGSIELDALTDALDKVPEEFYEQGPVILHRGSRAYDLRGLRLVVAAAGERGETELVAPVPHADQNPGGGGRIGDFFSEDRLLEAATRIYEAALVGYRELVNRWMPTLFSQLEHYVLMPMRIVGFINNGRRREDFGRIPTLAGYVEALPEGSDDEIRMQSSDHDYDYRAGKHSYDQQRAARPQAKRSLTGTHGGMSFEVGTRYPVSDVVYKWIAHDLKRLGLVGALAHSGSSQAVVPFDVGQ